jgi:hypothetical protein
MRVFAHERAAPSSFAAIDVRIGGDIPSGTLEQIRILAEQAKRVVAAHAEEATDRTSPVVVIDVERDPRCWRALTKCADAVLCLEDRVVLVDREAELVAQMNLAELLETLVAILFGPGLYPLRIRLLPRPYARDLPFGIQPVSPEPHRVRTCFALGTTPIASTAVPVELSESLRFSALLAALYSGDRTERV